VSATLCVGQAVVELVGEGGALHPRVAGAASIVALSAARSGARVALAGAVGEDAWGRWLHERIAGEGVDVSSLALVSGAKTPIAFVGELEDRYGGAIIPPAVDLDRAAALVLTADALSEDDYRRWAMDVRSRALELDLPVIFEAGVGGAGWRSRADAAATANACVPRALLVLADQAGAALMTGEVDPERAALALVKAGARLVLITLGLDGAILRGELRRDVDEPRDDLAGMLVAKLALSDFYPPVVAASLA
jgi:5-dehydro-2-deoxygluconokinase